MRKKKLQWGGGWVERIITTLLFTVFDAWKEVRTESVRKESQMKVFISELKVETGKKTKTNKKNKSRNRRIKNILFPKEARFKNLKLHCCAECTMTGMCIEYSFIIVNIANNGKIF